MARRAGAAPAGNPIPSSREILRAVGADSVRKAYGMRAPDVLTASALMQQGPKGQFVSPLQSLPTAASVGEFTETLDMFGSNRDRFGRYQNRADDVYADSMEEYSFTEDGYNYENLAEDAQHRTSGPAPLSLVPTSTINPDRPRTVAAGYLANPTDSADGKLSVVFRDGTFYNYYNVSMAEWNAFKQNRSKGRFILRFLDSKPRGAADVDGADDAGKLLLYRIARTSQSSARDGKTTQINYESRRQNTRRF